MKALNMLIIMFTLSSLGYAQSDSLNFGFEQKVMTKLNIPGYSDSPISILLNDNGKMFLTGQIRETATTQDYFPLKCLNTDGSIDTTFKEAEILITDTKNEGFEGTSILLQDNRKIVVSGRYNRDFAVARFESDGSFDTTFNNLGMVTTDFNNSHDIVNSAAIQEDGKIVLAGYTRCDSSGYSLTRFALTRYNTDGKLDNTFGTSGKVTTPVESFWNWVNDIAIQSDGKILATGMSRDLSDDDDFAIVRYNIDGSLDTSFGDYGKVNTDFYNDQDRGHSIIIQPDGKFIVGGYAQDGVNNYFALVRYNVDGSIDSTYGNYGKVITSFYDYENAITEKSIKIPPPQGAKINSMYLQSDGKVMASGTSENYDFNYDFAFARYMPDGKLDTTFASSGKLLIDFGTETDFCYSSSYLTDIGCVFAGKIISSTTNYYDIAIYGFLNELDLGIITQKETMEKVFVYPNPIKEDFILVYELEQPAIVTINIYDISGKIIYNSSHNRLRSKGKKQENIHLPTNIPPGCYILSLDINKNRHNVRIIVN